MPATAWSYSYFLHNIFTGCLGLQLLNLPNYSKSCILEYLHYYSFTSTHDPALGPAVKRKFKAGGRHDFRAMEISYPVAISEHKKHMAGADLADLNDHATPVRKDLKELRWYFRVFLKMIMMATFNAFILKNSIKPHKNN